jgi:hypothetical protein
VTRDCCSPKGSSDRRRSSGGTRPYDLNLDNAGEVLCLTSREWLCGSDLQAALPQWWLGFLCSSQQWAYKDRSSYGSMVRKSLRNREVRSENPFNPAWVQRVAFSYQEGVNLRRLVLWAKTSNESLRASPSRCTAPPPPTLYSNGRSTSLGKLPS